MNYSADIEAAARIAAASPRGATYGDILAEVRKKQPGIALVTVRRWANSSAPGCGMALAECRTTKSTDLERRRLFLTEQQAYASGFVVAYFVGQTHVGRRDELLQAIQKHGFIDAQMASVVMDCCVEYAQRHLALMTSHGLISCNGRMGADRRWYIGEVPKADLLPSLRETLLKLAARPEGIDFDVAPWGKKAVAKTLGELFKAGSLVRRRTRGASRYFVHTTHADAWLSSVRSVRREGIKAKREKTEAARCNHIAASITREHQVQRTKVSLPKQVEVVIPENVKRTVCPTVMDRRFRVAPGEVSGVFGALGPGQYLKGREDSPFTAYLKGL